MRLKAVIASLGIALSGIAGIVLATGEMSLARLADTAPAEPVLADTGSGPADDAICRASPGASATALFSDLKLPLRTEITFSDLSGRPLIERDADKVFRIDARFYAPPRMPLQAELKPRGWLRPLTDDGSSCEDRLRQLRLSRHILPRGTIDLSKPLIGVAAADGSFTIVDPALNLASANIVAAAKLEQAPDALEADSVHGRFIVTLTDAGRVEAIDMASAARQVIADGLEEPSAAYAIADGSIWIVEGGGRLSRHSDDGVDVIADGLRLVSASRDRRRIAAQDDAGSIVIETESRVKHVLESPPITAVAPLPAESEFAVAAVNGRMLHLIGKARHEILLLDFPGSVITVDPQGGWLTVHETAEPIPVSLVDLEAVALRQSVPVTDPVTEISFGHDIAFVMTADQAMIRAIDLSTGTPGTLPVRRLPFGKRSVRDVSNDGLLVPMGDGHSTFAVHRESYTGFILHSDLAKTDMPPMHPVRLRGGVPYRIATVDRGFRPKGEGRFASWARIDEPKRYELVLENGLDFSATCVRLPEPPANLMRERGKGRLELLETTGDSLAIRLLDWQGEPVSNSPVAILLTGLRTSDRNRFHTKSDSRGHVSFSGLRAYPRPFAIIARLPGHEGLTPLVLQ